MSTAGLTISIWFALFYLALTIVWLVIWVLTLIHQAKNKKWAWFVLTLLLQFVAVIYWISWTFFPNFRKKKK